MKKLKAEFIKMGHTFLFPVHLLVPIISCSVFLAWTRIERSASVFCLCAGYWRRISGSCVCVSVPAVWIWSFQDIFRECL